MDVDLRGLRVIITAGAAGIGRATAEPFAANGARVHVCDVDERALTTIETIGHAMEDVLLQAKEGEIAFSPELFDLLYQALDAVGLVINRLEAGETSTP